MNTAVKIRRIACASVIFILFFCCRIQASEEAYNIVLIVIDAVRADHLGCYGYARDTSPTLDALARQGILFTRAYSQSCWTLPSITSLFTSRYVRQHRVFNVDTKLSETELTLAEILKMYGYETAAFTSGIFLNRQFNLCQGFDVYEDIPLNYDSDIPRPPKKAVRDLLPRVVQWLKKEKDGKFFVFIHIMEAHPPLHLPADGNDNMFDPGYAGKIDGIQLDLKLRDLIFGNFLYGSDGTHRSLSPADKNHIVSHYDAAIRYIDRYIDSLLKTMKALDLMKKSIFIITADHGMDFFEHDTLFNFGSQAPYEEVTHVPLIIIHPDSSSKGRKISRPVELIDVLPTILDSLGIPPKRDAEGISLLSLIRGEIGDIPLDRKLFSTGGDERSKNLEQCSSAVWAGAWKLIVRPQYHYPLLELYNINDDPGESKNSLRQNREIADKLYNLFRKWAGPAIPQKQDGSTHD